MKSLMAVITVIAGLVIAAATAQALPRAPLAADPVAVNVAGGCGPGGHRGPYGGCRPMYNCPPGWHSGPYGRHCFRNW